MAAHTPGPWNVKYELNVDGPNRRGIALTNIYSTNGPDELDVIEENKANAQLIAAAPDLLAACEALLAERPETAGFMAWMNDREDQVRAAVAKARGVI
jgi:hypothetical protein